MARSYKKTPIIGNASCSSEKEDKKCWHSRFRAANRDALASIDEALVIEESRADSEYDIPVEDLVFPATKEVSDPWGFGKDGKHWIKTDNLRCKPSERFYENKERRSTHSVRRKERK